MEKEKFINDNIGETLLITLYMKCRESRQPAPIIMDKTACRLVEGIDYDFGKFEKGIKSSVGVAIRSRYFDEMAKSFIAKRPNPVVVIVGCGLDSRRERLGDMADLADFYQLDIPEVIRIRERLLPADGNEIFIAASMLETLWMDELRQIHPKGDFLFIVEGLFMYFEKTAVRNVFENLAMRFPGGEILFDIVNAWMSRNSHLHDTVKHTSAKFRFGTNDDREMESWADNLHLVASKKYTDFKEWRRTGLKGWLMGFVPVFRNAGRMLHYKIS